MRLNETSAAKRRVGPFQCRDSDGNAVTSGFAGNVEISVNDAPFVLAAGTVGVIGDGYVYYQATALDCSVRGFISIRISGICLEFVMREEIETFPQGIPVGTTNPDELHLGPLRVVDDSGNVLPDMTGVTTQISVNGNSWDVPAGTFVEMEDGYWDYVPDATEVSGTGWIAIRLAGDCQEYVFRSDISSVSALPIITAVSPTPGVAPGEAGGFQNNRKDAIKTPIIITISDADPGLNYLMVTLRVFQDDDTEGHTELVVYRDGAFREPFGDSTQSTFFGTVTLNIRRDGGWTGLFEELSIYAVDASGNAVSETFIYELPDTFVAVESEVPEGDLDHVAAALARIPWQFRAEARDL